MLGLVAQLRSRSAFPSITRTVYSLMLAALTLVQAALVRASICDELCDHRFCVFSPSVNSTITLSRSGAGAAAPMSGKLPVRACQPHTRPMVTLVLPAAVIWSTLPCSAVQSVLSGITCVSDPQVAAGNLVL